MQVDVHQRQQYRDRFYQTRQRFATHFLQYAIEYQHERLWLEIEHDNLLKATRHFTTVDQYRELLAFRDALQVYLDLQGYWADSSLLNDRAIAMADRCGDQENLARLTHDRADIFHQLGEYRQAAQLYETSEQIYIQLNNKERAIASRHMRALVVRALGQLAEADHLCETVIAEAHQLGLHTWIAHPLYVRALLARDRPDLSQ